MCDISYIKKEFAMKKNILIIPSLLILPLITPSHIVGMERTIPNPTFSIEELQQVALARKNRLNKVEEVLEAWGKQGATNTNNSNNNTNFPLVITETTILKPLAKQKFTPEISSVTIDYIPFQEIITPVPQNSPATTRHTANPSLFESCILPTEQKDLDVWDMVDYQTSSPDEVVEIIIELLDTNTFDPSRHFTILENAIQIALSNYDMASFETIIELYHTKFPQAGVSDNLAAYALDSYSPHYATTIDFRNKELQDGNGLTYAKNWRIAQIACMKKIYQALNQFDQETGIAAVANQEKTLKTLLKLNKSIRPEGKKILANNMIHQPQTICSPIMAQTADAFASIKSNLDLLTTTPQPKQNNNLAIDQKK